MPRDELLKRISINPNICFTKPCIRGHRIWALLIPDFMAEGMSHAEILQQYPQLETVDLLACVAYSAARLA